MPSDPRAAGAREAHRLAGAAAGRARELRRRRDDLVRQLRTEDPDRWTYGQIANAVGCSIELVGKILGRKS